MEIPSEKIRKADLNLLFSVLIQAIQDYINLNSLSSKRYLFSRPTQDEVNDNRMFLQAKDYLLVNDDSGVFSFVNICRTFGFDVDELRSRLKELKKKQKSLKYLYRSGYRIV